MTVFWGLAALMVGVALWGLLPPLARRQAAAIDAPPDENAGNLTVLREQLAQIDAERAAGALDEAQHRRARDELERRVIDEERAVRPPTPPGPARATAWTVALAVPLIAVAGYLWLGAPAALKGAGDGALAGGRTPTPQEVEAMVDQLARRMQAEPGDPKGWAMLGRSYLALQRFDDAAAAYARAVALRPEDASLLADHADALAMAQGQDLSGEPTRLVERALQIDPAHLKALALAGSAAMSRKDFPAAIAYWQRALQQLPAGSELATAIEGSIAEAQALAGPGPGPARAAAASAAAVSSTPATPSGALAPPGAAATLGGRVSLAPALAARVQPGDTVFIVARAASGPRMPLAILRRTASDLPIAFTLDDSLAMSPQWRLSNVEQAVVSARVSRSGDATPRSGDLIGQGTTVRIGTTGLAIVIDAVQP